MTTPPTDDAALLRVLARACEWNYQYESSEAPDWLNSVDAALALPWPADCEISTWTSHGMHDAYLKVWQGNDIVGRYEKLNEDTLARALCEVFYQWAVAQESEQTK